MRAFNPDQAQTQIKTMDERLAELLKNPLVKEALDILDKLEALEGAAFRHGFEVDGKNVHLK